MELRQFVTSSGKLVLAGKSAESNEDLIEQASPDEKVLHTEKPGSPFVNIKGKPTKSDIKEAAIFCAKYSQDWRDHKKDVTVHLFNARDTHKEKGMKLGTFGVRKVEKIKVKKSEILAFEKELKEFEKEKEKLKNAK